MNCFKRRIKDMNLQTKHCFLKQITQQHTMKGIVKMNDLYLLSTEESLEVDPFSHSIFWAIRVENEEEYIGFIGLYQSNTQFCYELSFRLFNENIADCLMIEVLQEVINYGFQALNTPRIQAKISTLNQAMIQLLCQVGMRLEEKVIEKEERFSIYTISNEEATLPSKMRTSHEIMKQMISFVEQKEGIRALLQTGLRLNIHAPIDLMRDYHFNWFMRDEEVAQFTEQTEWMSRFGEIVIYHQINLTWQGMLFQIQYKDGVRLDIQIVPLSHYLNVIYKETLAKVLIDKDKLLPPIDEPNDSAHYVQMPLPEEFKAVMDDLWWFQIEVAKAIYRDELPLAKWLYDGILMDRLRQLLIWKVGNQFKWSIDIGRYGRWLKRYLSESIYSDFIHLYPNNDYISIWESLFNLGPFINEIAKDLSDQLGYDYDLQQGHLVTDFLHRINSLPDNASDFNV